MGFGKIGRYSELLHGSTAYDAVTVFPFIFH
jgi:hypothetical protein